MCGDGVCEAPWEFSSYSTFGCRADCGQLQLVQQLTPIQIDLSWDFSHPLGSIPASTLMQQALWNLCPYGSVQYSSACYYSPDNSFTQLSGASSNQVLDCPDGLWSIDVKRDIFDKVGGSVRASQLVINASYYVKVYIAAASTLAEMNLENSLLTNAMTQGNMSFFSWMNYTLRTNYTNSAGVINATQAAWELNQMIGATCSCIGYNASANGTTYGTGAYAMLNRSMDHFNQGPSGKVFGAGGLPTPSAYQLTYCQPLVNSTTPTLYEYNTYNLTIYNSTNPAINGTLAPINGTSKFYGPVPSPLPAGVTYVTLYNQLEPSPNMTATCARVIANVTTWTATMLRRIQNFTVDWRMGDGSSSGKYAARKAVTNQLQSYIIYNNSELFTPIFASNTYSYGTTATGVGMLTASVSTLQSYFITSPLFYTSPMPASQVTGADGIVLRVEGDSSSVTEEEGRKPRFPLNVCSGYLCQP